MGLRKFIVVALLLATVLVVGALVLNIPEEAPAPMFHESFTHKGMPNFTLDPTSIKEEITLTDHHTANGWNLMWHDEFDKGDLNTFKWNALYDNNGWGKRSQLYSPNNVEVKEDLLNIHIRKEAVDGFSYTSGAVTTQGKFEFQYGKLEVRAKMPKGKGLLPALWLMSASGELYPEIDFAELDGDRPKELWHVVHDYQAKKVREYKMIKTADVSNEFHTYGIEWSADKIDFFFDGELTFTATKLVPQEPMYIYINTGVGGTWVGEPSAKTIFPNHMLVDYVRYYEK